MAMKLKNLEMFNCNIYALLYLQVMFTSSSIYYSVLLGGDLNPQTWNETEK